MKNGQLCDKDSSAGMNELLHSPSAVGDGQSSCFFCLLSEGEVMQCAFTIAKGSHRKKKGTKHKEK